MGDYLSRFTFYDVMGYFLPGLLGLCAALLAASAIDPAWVMPAVATGRQWFILIVAAYFAGHAVQGLAYRAFPRSASRAQVARKASPAVLAVVAKALEHHEMTVEDAVGRFAALDALKVEFGDREVFVARQGFFRGSALSFAALGVVLVVACLFGRQVCVFAFAFDRALCGIGGVLGVGIGVLFFFRYRDFLRHEFEYAAAAVVKEHERMDR